MRFALARDIAASVAILFALTAPVLLIAAGLAVDYANLERERSRLKGVADAAAVAGARAAGATPDLVRAAAAVDDWVDSHVPAAKAETSLSENEEAVRVLLAKPANLYFEGLLGFGPIDISVRSAATLPESTAVCIHVLDPSASSALSLDSNARIEAANCAAHVNSTSSSAITAYSNSRMRTEKTCVAGNYSGGSAHYDPRPESDCDAEPDGLAGIAEPSVGSCNYSNLELDDVSRVLNPATYCGGILIKGNANITFQPGTYIIKDGKFEIDSNSRVYGNGVTFYLTGSNATLYFKSNAEVDFTAPKDGPLAGLLFFEARNAPLNRTHRLDSNNINRIEGTIYLSRGTLSMDSNSTIGAQSKFTRLVVRRLKLDSNARLVLNADYKESEVPVAGLESGFIRLIE